MYRHSVAFKKPLAGIAHGPHAIVAAPPAKAIAAPETPALRSLLAECQRLADDVKRRRQPAFTEVAQMSVELGVALAERLIGAEIAADRQRLGRIIETTLERMSAARFVVVRGHPADLALLQQQMDAQTDLHRYRDLLTFRPEATLKRGQFKLEADEWFTEWDTNRALADLRAALMEETFTDE